MNAIETNRLSRRYGRTEAVHDLNLLVPTGGVFALLGSNGAGKTTTIRMLMNLLAPSAGSARVLGVDSRQLGPAQRAQIGYVSENQRQPLWMTVRQLLDYCRPFYPTWDAGLERRLLEQFALPEDRKLRHLSRGMLMKAALLSSLAYRPRLLVLDEPFSGLDPLARDDFISGVIEAADLGDWTVLVSSHDIEEVERLSDHIALLEEGRLQFSEPTESLLRRFRRVEVRRLEPAQLPAAAPGTWLNWERTGDSVRYVDSAFDPAGPAGRWTGGAAVEALPMTLREIVVVLARQKRLEQKGAAA